MDATMIQRTIQNQLSCLATTKTFNEDVLRPAPPKMPGLHALRTWRRSDLQFT